MIAWSDFGMLQISGIVFAVFALSRAILRFKDHSIKGNELVFWTIIWGGVISVAIFPSIFVMFSKFLGIGRGVDTLIYTGIIILFYLLFRVYVKVEAQQKEITMLVREIAIQNPVQKKQK